MLKKTIGYVHLWLGLLSGLVIFIVCLTGAIWCFSPEIENLTESYRHVIAAEKTYLPVSTLQAIAEKQTGDKISRIYFNGRDKAVMAELSGDDNYSTVFINPYYGKILKVITGDDFFGWILEGHCYLWMGNAGGQIVRWGTLIFLIMLISGIILWWPKNKSASKQRFWFQWKPTMKWKRRNYDLHNILGFYACWIIIFAVLTGIVWSFDRAAKIEYWLASGGKVMPEFPHPISVKPIGNAHSLRGIESLFMSVTKRYNHLEKAVVIFPHDDSAVYTIRAMKQDNHFAVDYYYFNQYTYQETPVYSYGKYKDAGTAEKLSRMNYDIHIGNLAGLPGRIAMFFGALAGASLPVTGFIIWFGKKKKGYKKMLTEKKELIRS